MLTIDEDIEFWTKASRHEGQSRDLKLLAFGIAAGLRMAKQDHANEFRSDHELLLRNDADFSRVT